MAILVRAAATALVLLALLRFEPTPPVMPRSLLFPALVMGVLVAVQSYCLYSAVAIMPAALALLVFQTCPIIFFLLAWITGKESLRSSALAPMLLALGGLAVALDVLAADWSARRSEIGLGATWALTGAVAFALILFCNAYWVRAVDGRLRTLAMTSVAAFLVLLSGLAADALTPPDDVTGWVGIGLLSLFYCAATTSLFVALPRLTSASTTAALNFEPIAALILAWLFLGQTVTAVQLVGALVTVSAVVWLSISRS